MNADHLICQVIDKYQVQKGPKHRALRRTVFYHYFAQEVTAKVHPKSSFLQKLFHPAGYLEVDLHCCHLLGQQKAAHRVKGFREA